MLQELYLVFSENHFLENHVHENERAHLQSGSTVKYWLNFFLFCFYRSLYKLCCCYRLIIMKDISCCPFLIYINTGLCYGTCSQILQIFTINSLELYIAELLSLCIPYHHDTHNIFVLTPLDYSGSYSRNHLSFSEILVPSAVSLVQGPTELPWEAPWEVGSEETAIAQGRCRVQEAPVCCEA